MGNEGVMQGKLKAKGQIERFYTYFQKIISTDKNFYKIMLKRDANERNAVWIVCG